jgi:pimeloyl-ACP methyl ester carboxylesterase
MLKRILIFLMAISIIFVVVYMLGPKSEVSSLEGGYPEVPTTPESLEAFILAKSDTVKGLKPDNEAKIIWDDSLNKQKTPYSIIYIHGFGASQMEGDPVHRGLAEHFGANLYLVRLPEHGIKREDAMRHLTAQRLVDEVREAYMVGKALGDSIIIVGTSMGGALTLVLASEQPDIKAILLYSPAIREYGDALEQFFQPWTKTIAENYSFPNGVRKTPREGDKARFWSEEYHINAFTSLAVLLRSTMIPQTFKKVNQPLFLGYFYKSDQEQDFVVSVPQMLNMFEAVSTPDALKQKTAFPDAGDHVIASSITSKDWKGVLEASILFLEEKVGVQRRATIEAVN